MRKRFLIFAAALCAFCSQAALADALASPRVFTRGSFVYVVEPQRIVYLSMDTRGSHTIYTAADSQFTLSSAVRSGDVIWVSNNMGAIIAVNMQTGGLEEFGRGFSGDGGQLDADRRFVWHASGDTLYRMDLTTREWVSLPIPGRGLEIRGLISFNDRVHVISAGAVYVFNPASGDWVTVPHKGFTLSGGDFHKVGESAFFTRDKTVYRYDPSKRLWNKIPVGGRIRAADFTSDRLAVATENRVYHISARDFTLIAQPSLHMLRGIRSIALHKGRAVGVVDNGLAIYNTPFDFDLAVFPDYVKTAGDVFAFSYYDHIMLYAGDNFIIYNIERKLWSGVRVFDRGGERERKFLPSAWDEDGAYARFTDEHKAALNGTATFSAETSANYFEDGSIEIDVGYFSNATLNVRAESETGRFLDLTVDNAVTTLPPEKSLYYKGLDSDVFSRASFGVQEPGLIPGQITPVLVTEGGSAVFSSVTKTENRDRNFTTATAGSGYVLSKTEWRWLDYNPSGFYHIHIGENREAIASSVKMYVDGIPLPESDYIYDPAGRFVRLLRRDKSNPTNVIQISYQERVFPNDRFVLEPLPENHFGQYHFVEGAVSPRSWISARAGLLALDHGDGLLSPVALAGIPVELRGDNRSLLLYPEVAYNNKTGAHSAGFAMGARENRAFGSYRGLWAGQDYRAMDRHTFAYQDLRDEHEINVGYDLLDNLRADWYQVHRRVEGADLSHFELRSSYIGNSFLPDVELSASSRFMESGPGAANRSRKETFTLRLSDMSSRLLSEANRLHNVGYDFSWTEYQDHSNNINQGGRGGGRVVYGSANISPISSLTLAGTGAYIRTPSNHQVQSLINPSLFIYTNGLPPGFDISMANVINVTNHRIGASTVNVARNIAGYFYPGEYIDALEKTAFYFRYANEMDSEAYPTESLLRYSFIAGKNTHAERIMEELGLIYFPMENLLLSTINSRYRNYIDDPIYSSNERVKLWLENGSALEGNFRFKSQGPLLHLSADALYEHRFQGGLLAGAGMFGVRESTDEETNLSAGPQFIVSLTKETSGFVKSVENSHLLWAALNDAEISNPDFNYALYLRLKMSPNISLVAEFQASVIGMREANVSGGLYLHAGF